MPSNLDIEITDGNLVLEIEIGPPESIDVDLTESTPTFNALTGPGLKGDPGEDGVDGTDGDRGPKGDPGTTYVIVTEVLSNELQDGVNVHFSLNHEAVLNSAVQVFRNGLMEVYGLGYTATTTHVTFATPPLDSDILVAVYEKVQ